MLFIFASGCWWFLWNWEEVFGGLQHEVSFFRIPFQNEILIWCKSSLCSHHQGTSNSGQNCYMPIAENFIPSLAFQPFLKCIAKFRHCFFCYFSFQFIPFNTVHSKRVPSVNNTVFGCGYMTTPRIYILLPFAWEWPMLNFSL